MNAVIVDIKKKQAAALDENGRIVRVHNAGYEIGQTIELHEDKHVRMPKMLKRFSAGVAAAVLVAMLGTASAYAMPYGTVTLDGSSSIEYTINCFDYVLKVKGTNEEGEALLAGIDARQICHHRIDAAVAVTIEHMEEPYAIDPAEAEIRITTDTVNDHHTERLQQELEPLIGQESPIPPERQFNHETPPSDEVFSREKPSSKGNMPPAESGQLPDQKEVMESDSISQDGPASNGEQNVMIPERPNEGSLAEPDTPEKGFIRPEENSENRDGLNTSIPSH